MKTAQPKANNSKNILRLEIFETLFEHSSKPFKPGDVVIADKVNSINSRLNTRFYFISKNDKKGLFFTTITEYSEYYSILAEHETEPININKDILFEAVDVYEVLYYESVL